MRLKTIKPRIASLGSRVQPGGGSWRDGKTSTERGYGYRWQKAREHYLRLHPLCCYCEREGRAEVATVVDHKEPHRGDMTLFWDEENWQPLCKPCHDSVKQLEESMGGAG